MSKEGFLQRKLFEKKATGHIEMLIGFTFFIGTVLFIFIMIRLEFSDESNASFLLEKLEQEFIKKIETESVSFFVKLDPAQSGCISIDIPEYNMNSSYKSKVISLGNRIESEFASDKISIDESAGQNFLIYLSESFDSETYSCSRPTTYEIGPLKKESYQDKAKILQLKNRYDNDYENLKNEFNIGDIYDFSIEFEDQSLTLEKRIPETLEVFTKEVLLRVIDENANIKNTEAILKIW